MNWKKHLEKTLAENYKGATIKWDGDNPTLVVPDNLKPKAREIVDFMTRISLVWRGSGIRHGQGEGDAMSIEKLWYFAAFLLGMISILLMVGAATGAVR